MTMKVLITGATGFLGGYLIDECLSLGYEVLAVGRNLEVGRRLERPGVRFYQADLRDKTSLKAAFAQEPDRVVHAGALSTVWGPWQDFYESNVLGTKHVLELSQHYDVERMVFVSSPSIYAKDQDQLAVREDQAPKENHLNHYIQSKIEAERLVSSQSAVPYVIVRPRGLFGLGDTSIIPRLLSINDRLGIPIVGDGQQLVDVTCVENVAHAIGLMLENPIALEQTYNITNDQPMAFKQLLEMFFQISGEKANFRKLPAPLLSGLATGLELIYKGLHLKGEPALTRYTYNLLRYSQTLSIDKAKEELGYRPILSIEEGIRHYVQNKSD